MQKNPLPGNNRYIVVTPVTSVSRMTAKNRSTISVVANAINAIMITVKTIPLVQ